MGTRFNLLEEDWIPCVYPDGVRERGVLAALRDAAQIREITAASPLATFGLYRFLVGVVHWVDPASQTEQWRRLWGQQCFAPSVLTGLAKRGRGLFDLFDEDHPFLQDLSVGSTKGKEHYVSDLAVELPAGTNINHFRHTFDREAELCPACVARGLVSLPVFCTSGGRGLRPGINGEPPLYLLPMGGTLFQTLALNLPIREVLESEGVAFPRGDAPAWAIGGDGTTDAEPVGYLAGVTWQPRRVLLPPPSDRPVCCTLCGQRRPGAVRGQIGYANWDRDPPSPGQWADPHAVRTTTVKGKTVPVRPPILQKRWRSQSILAVAKDWSSYWRIVAESILRQCVPDQPLVPVFAQLRHLARSGRLDDLGAIVTVAYSFHTVSGQAKYYRAEADYWPLRLGLLTTPAPAQTLSKALASFGERLDRTIDVRLGTYGNKPQHDLRAQAEARDLLATLEAAGERGFRKLLRAVDSAPGSASDLAACWLEEQRALAAAAMEPQAVPAATVRGLQRQRGFARLIDEAFSQGA